MRNLLIQVGVGVIGVVAIVATLREETPKARSPKVAPPTAIAAVASPAPKPVVPAARVQATPQQAPSQQAAEAPAAQAPAITVPAGDPEQVRSWLLSAPDAEFAALVGTKELDSAVAQVVNGLSFREVPIETTAREVDDFLSRINNRIQSVASTR